MNNNNKSDDMIKNLLNKVNNSSNNASNLEKELKLLSTK